MALTPEDVVNKQFQTTKFREGYDQDEVDDFLDEVVEELRRLTRENEDLRQRLASAESGAPVAVAETTEVVTATAPAAPAEDSSLDSENATNLLQLARRLHEEHVREGIQKRDALISEAQATATRIVAEAETQQRLTQQQGEQQKAILDQQIEELRIFERDYRSKLKGFIENQLGQLEASSSFAPAGLPGGDATDDQPAELAAAAAEE